MPDWCLDPNVVVACWVVLAGVFTFCFLPLIIGAIRPSEHQIQIIADAPADPPDFDDNSPSAQFVRMGMRRIAVLRECCRFFLGHWMFRSKPIQLFAGPDGREYAVTYQIFTGEPPRVSLITFLPDRKIKTANTNSGASPDSQNVWNSLVTGDMRRLRDRHRIEVANQIGVRTAPSDHCSVDRYIQGERDFDIPMAKKIGRDVALMLLQVYGGLLIVAVLFAKDQFGWNNALAPIVIMSVALMKILLDLRTWITAVMQRRFETEAEPRNNI